MREPRFLLYSGTRPGAAGVMEIILSDLVESLGPERVQCFHVAPRGGRGDEENPYVAASAERRFETGYRPVGGPVGNWIGRAASRFKLEPYAEQVAAQAVAAGRSFGADGVWALMNCPTTILTARRLAETLDVPLYVQVADDPELLCHQCNFDPQTARRLLTEFGRAMKAATSVAVIGESMRDAYHDRYGVDGVIMRHGLDDSGRFTDDARDVPAETATIGFAGSLTTPAAYQALVSALDSVSWRVAGRDVTLRLIGCHVRIAPSGPTHIEHLGWRSVAETLQLLSECDLLYLPQPFTPELRPLAELSFPTKLTTYLAAGRPVFLHAPEYGALTTFNERFGFAEAHNGLDAGGVLGTIESLIRSPERRSDVLAGGRLALEQELNPTVFQSRFKEFLGLPVHADAEAVLQ